MSRKWGRMVLKNKKELKNKSNKSIHSGLNNSEIVKFVGRSWLLPSFLIAMLIWYLILYIGEKGFMFWFTVIGYVALSLFLFFLKRPFLKIGKDYVESRRFGGIVKIDASEIAKFSFSKGSVNISFQGKRPSWTFTTLFQRMNIPLLSIELKNFAARNQITVDEKV